MVKKRGSCARFGFKKLGSKKAQITIFIILGIIILFTFLFVLFLNRQLQEGQLTKNQEETISRVFEKDALRSYMENCLRENLIGGLKLWLAQGTIWQSQGGNQIFLPGINGREVVGTNISYALLRSEIDPENKYPCPRRENSLSPDFCRYTFPNLTFLFGEKNFWLPTNNLQIYLQPKLERCLSDFLQSKSSAGIEIISSPPQVKIKLENQGLQINVDYPLKWKVGEEEFSQLNNFDFFYLSALKPFLESAVLRPLDSDRQFLDFAYTQETLQQGRFNFASERKFGSCSGDTLPYLCTRQISGETYRQLGITLYKNVIEGDTLLEFVPGISLGPGLESSTFKILRQNRPPVLSYLSRCPGEDYDFLFVPDNEENINLEFSAQALDPDEEETLIFSWSTLSGEENFVESNNFILPLPSDAAVGDIFTFIITVSDGYLSDWQEVRVKIGDEILC